MQSRIIYTFEIIFLVFIILLVPIYAKTSLFFTSLIVIAFFFTSTFILTRLLGFKRIKNVVSYNATQITIIALLIYILATYLSGLYFGFLKNAYAINPLSIIKNTYLIIFVIVSEELIRWIIACKLKRNTRPLIILTSLYVLLDVLYAFNKSVIASPSTIFLFTISTVIPSIARNILCSYITKNINFTPSLLIRLFFALIIYITPIIPDFGYYLNGIIAIIFPYILYLKMAVLVNYTDHRRINVAKQFWYMKIPSFILLSIIVILVSGVFKYKIMAIGSGSMMPYIAVGDAVIYEKYTDDEPLTKGEIIVVLNKGMYITHRIIDVNDEGFKTKGDANYEEDDYIVKKSDIIGVVKMRVKYIGYPTIWLTDKFK